MKFKFLPVAIVLLLLTIGVFAGHKKFWTGDLYAAKIVLWDTTFYQLSTSTSFSALSTSGTGLPCTISNLTNAAYPVLVKNANGSYSPVYSNGW